MRFAFKMPQLGLPPKASFTARFDRKKWQKTLLILELITGALLIAILYSIVPQKADTNPADAQVMEAQAATLESVELNDSEMKDTPDQVAYKEECAHQWEPITHVVEHPEKSHAVAHDAVYDTRIAFHTVCNECGEKIDGKAQEHIEKTGHRGFTVSVPFEEDVLVSEAWTETVIDEQAYSETVVDGYKCSLCESETGLSA